NTGTTRWVTGFTAKTPTALRAFTNTTRTTWLRRSSCKTGQKQRPWNTGTTKPGTNGGCGTTASNCSTTPSPGNISPIPSGGSGVKPGSLTGGALPWTILTT